MKAPEGLLDLLDGAAELLQRKLRLVGSMRDCVRKGDPSALGKMLAEEAALDAQGPPLEQGLRTMRARMAKAMGCDPKEATLGRLAGMLDAPDAIAVSDRRERLAVLADELGRESAATERLVRYALEVNSQMLATLVGDGAVDRTYQPNGAVALNAAWATFRHSV